MIFSARKANDFLRDKLTDITSQYTDAMERLQRAEYTHGSQTNALRIALDDLHNASAATFLRGIEATVDHIRPDLLAAASTAKLDATQKELSDSLIACTLAKESIARLEKR
jgi:hypothetical protein